MKKPSPRDFFTNDGMHVAMRDYANYWRGSRLAVTVVFRDGSVYETEFERAQVQVKYKTPDGDTYYQDVDSSKFINVYLDAGYAVSAAKLKEAFKAWVSEGEAVKSIKWKYVK